jgi:TonB family protein
MLKHRIALLAGIVILSVSFFLAGGPESDKGTVAYVDHPAWLQLAGLTGLNTPVILRFTETELQKIIQALGDATGTDVELMCDGTREVSIDLENTSMGEALVYLAAKLGLHYSVKPSGALIVKGPLLPGVGDVTNPVKRDYNYVPPTYPDAARKDLVEGSVILQTTIGADGTLTDLILLREDPPDYGFSESAMEAVRQWQYEPATLDGIPVPVYLTINVQFSLD